MTDQPYDPMKARLFIGGQEVRGFDLVDVKVTSMRPSIKLPAKTGFRGLVSGYLDTRLEVLPDESTIEKVEGVIAAAMCMNFPNESSRREFIEEQLEWLLVGVKFVED